MKKLIALFLVFALLVPFSALADESSWVGCWAQYSVGTDGTPTMTMIYLADDHTCYFVIQAFHHDEPGLGRSHVGTWELQPDGSVLAQTGNNTKTELTLYNDSIALNMKTMDVYVNITPFTLK